MLEQSADIIHRAISELKPYAILAMVSGGTDSLTAYMVAHQLNIPLDGFVHIVTGTGIPETTQWVRAWAEQQPYSYHEVNAGNAYEDYVLRKGFFGRGHIAHTYAYHLLKADPYRKLISRQFRQRKRGRRVLLINGARSAESENRMFKLAGLDVQQEKKGSPNYWVNIIRNWTANDCLQYLGNMGVKRNPVAEVLHRSAECMCGTMQSAEERREATFWFPKWGTWLDNLEQRVMCEFPWRWGCEMPKSYAQEKQGQIPLPGFQPMCSSCKINKE